MDVEMTSAIGWCHLYIPPDFVAATNPYMSNSMFRHATYIKQTILILGTEMGTGGMLEGTHIAI